MNWGTRKATQRVNASIGHMHREHSAYSNPTCGVGSFSILFFKVYENFDATVRKFLLELQKLRLIPSFS